MPLILVVEQDASYAEQITEALGHRELEVDVIFKAEDVLSYTASRRPQLVLASATFPDAKQILRHFSTVHGGPGAVAMIPINLMGEVSAADLHADALLAKPFSHEDLQSLVERFFPSAPLPPISPPASGPQSREMEDNQLTSQDIFGDVLAEVEAEARTTVPARRKRRPTSDVDIERRLEETLSGVLDRPTRKRPPVSSPPIPAPSRPRADAGPVPAYSDDEVDQLLDRTLSSLQIPTRPKASRPPTQSVPPATAEEFQTPPPAPPSFEPLHEPVESSPVPDAQAAFENLANAPNAAPVGLEPEPLGRDRLEPPSLDSSTPQPAPTMPPSAPPSSAPTAFKAVQDVGGDALQTQRLPLLQEPADDGIPFGEYSLLHRIAVGGMAEVWQARRRGVEGFQKTVAIKKILSHLTDSPDFVTMFIDEAKLAAQLNHNNIIQIYDLGKEGQDYFIAMEFVDGKDLRSILSAGSGENFPLPMGLALMIAARLARALDYAHRKRDFDNRDLGLVHRDVSPQNVLISYEAEIKLCDFGIVKAVAKASTTQMGALKGKLQYMSPEQAWGKSVDSRSDIFSLGSVLYEMLVGSKLFAADSEVGVLDAVRDCRISPPSATVPSIPPAVDNIVLKALAKHPEERYQTAGMMEQEIETFLQDLQPRPNEADLTNYLKQLFVEETSGRIAIGHLQQPGGSPQDNTGSLNDGSFESGLMALTESRSFIPEDSFGGTETTEESAALVTSETPVADAAPPSATAPQPQPQPQPSDSEAPAPISTSEMEDAPPQSSTAQGEVSKSSVLPKVAVALLILALLVVAALFFLRQSDSPASETPKVTSPPAAPAPTVVPDEASSTTPEGDPVGDESATVAGSNTEAEASDPVEEAEGTQNSAIPADLEKIVEEELTKREQQLRQEFEARKKQLEAELEATRAAAPPSESGGSGGGAPSPNGG